MQRAQATWIALDRCISTKASSPIPGQEQPPKPLRSAEKLWGEAESPHVAPQQSTTDVTEIEAVQRTEVLDRQSGSEVLGETDTGDECSPPHFVDIPDGKSRAMDQYGWSASSFEESPAGCRCG